jgi:uncharacterized protein YjiS (DUF1127 family)
MIVLTEKNGIAPAFALSAWAIRNGVRRFLNRRSITAVSALSDRQLNDMGLTSPDFRWAARQPLHIDASGERARIVRERCSGRGQRIS